MRDPGIIQLYQPHQKKRKRHVAQQVKPAMMAAICKGEDQQSLQCHIM